MVERLSYLMKNEFYNKKIFVFFLISSLVAADYIDRVDLLFLFLSLIQSLKLILWKNELILLRKKKNITR